jgi:hypothetical protein
MAQVKEEWSPEKRAFASQWLIEQSLNDLLNDLREKMPPAAFMELADAVNLLLSAWRTIAKEK